MQNASESQIEMDQQYALPDEIDIDIFSKKRAVKANDDDVENEQPRSSDVSNRQLIEPENLVRQKSSTKKRLVRPTLVTQETKEIAAGINSVKKDMN